MKAILRPPFPFFDTAFVAYRHVNVEGYVTHRLNFYSVPWSYIGQPKPLLEELADLHRDTLDPLLRADAIGPRPTSDYQHLLLSEELPNEPPTDERPTDETDSDPKPA